MASGLESYVNHTVSIITSDGRNFVGTLKGFDQTINLILDESHERVYSTNQGVEQVVLGLHIIRGDNVSLQQPLFWDMIENLHERYEHCLQQSGAHFENLRYPYCGKSTCQWCVC
ncbi:U6 snRNA-associated Sm-like protein LSm8 isoform X1 [Cryptotermes secundus]|uniref:U6 snRNA-associated Sm-like protein LSm8 isoform X1 n=1 Tax=Cryptotermes secundus TaxID=105785 RepID=UPI000CD7BD69|nr:U6 snRNA-associated Sm-like protein LSm8 isoform X1 [Cryptotermes secundus]